MMTNQTILITVIFIFFGAQCQACDENENNVTFTIKLDFYESELSWSLKEIGSSSDVFTGDGALYSDYQLITQSSCIDDGCYMLLINDSYGDGMYSSGDYGYYQLFLNDDQITLGKQTFDDDYSLVKFCTDLFDIGDGFNNDTSVNTDINELTFEIYEFKYQVKITDLTTDELVYVNNYEFMNYFSSTQYNTLYISNDTCYSIVFENGAYDTSYYGDYSLTLNDANTLVSSSTATTSDTFNLCNGQVTESDSSRCYSIKISTLTLGGSEDNIYMILEGYSGKQTEIMDLGSMEDGDTDYYFTRCDLADVGTIRYALIYNFGDDDIIIDEVTIDNSYTVEEYWGDSVGYDGSSSSGCSALTVDFGDDEMTVNNEEPCTISVTSAPTPSPVTVTSYTTRCYDILISTLSFGGSDDNIYMKMEGYTGIETNLTKLTGMEDGDTEYYFTRCKLIDVGSAIRYAKLYNFGDDDIIIDEVTVDGIYTVEEYWGDTLGYDGDETNGCAALTVDFYYSEMYAEYEEPCSVITDAAKMYDCRFACLLIVCICYFFIVF